MQTTQRKTAWRLHRHCRLLFLCMFSSVVSLNSVGEEGKSESSLALADTSDRKDRLLNVFNIVRFPNNGCNTTSDTYGVCYTATECISLGGSSSGSCASGFGVCCAFSGGCGGSTSVNNTYFKSDGSETSPCQFEVCKCSSDICQIRLGFDSFDILQPSTNQPGDAIPNQRTQCINAQFSASSDGQAAPIICGTNTGYHMILDARDDCNKLTFTWSSSGTRTWNIHVMQIACTDKWKPPEGCLQFFTGTTGTINSYNYLGGTHLANQKYSNCIRAERGYCSISYSSTSFELSDTASTSPTSPTAFLGDSCTQDYIIIAGGGATADANTNFDRFCGPRLNLDAASTIAAAILTNKMPFHLGVVFDGTELDVTTPAALTENSKGFEISYTQTAC